MITYLKKLAYPQLLLLAFFLSLLLSYVAILPNNPINVDGILYVKTAQVYLTQGTKAAFQTYSWPFFSILGALLHKLTKLSILGCFTIMNALWQGILVIAFIRLVAILGGNRSQLLWAALIILIYPFLNSVRDYTTRDFGYWALSLLAIGYLLKFFTEPYFRYALWFGVFMTLASLFRIEGLIMLAISPLPLLWQARQTALMRITHFLLANLILILGIIAAFVWHNLHHSALSSSRLIDFSIQIKAVLPDVIHSLHANGDKIRLAFLTEAASQNGATILTGGLILVWIISIISVMKPLYFLLACYGQEQGLIPNSHGKQLLIWLLIVNAVMLLVFVFETYFISPRYVAFMALIWMLWIPFALEQIYLRSHKRMIWKIIIIILAIMAFSGIIHLGYSKAYITQSGLWLQKNQPWQTRLFTNSKEIGFYASHEYGYQKHLDNISEGDLKTAINQMCRYDYLALRINKSDNLSPEVNNFISHHAALKTFSNKRNDKVLIYQTQSYCQALAPQPDEDDEDDSDDES